LASSYFGLGQAFIRIGKYLKAKFYLLKACELCQENLSPYDLQIAEINTLLGRLEYSQNRFQSATKHYQLALSIHEQQENPGNYDLSHLHNLLGTCFASEQKFGEALCHYQKALQILKKRMSAPCDYDDKQIDMMIAKIYGDIAQIYLYDKQFDEALKNAQIYLKISRKYPTQYFDLSNSLLLIGSVYRNKELYKRALRFLQEARGLITKCSYKDRIELFPYIYAELGICYENMNNHRYRMAYKYYNLAKKSPVSTTSENFRRDMDENIKRLQSQYEYLLET
jgi:tetratricopeptide (TPR) repeat protein